MAGKSVSFETTLSSFGNNTGIEVPPKLMNKLGGGKRPSVLVNIDGYEYQNTVGVTGGKYLVSVSAAVRKETGLSGGDRIRVTLTLAEGPRPVEMSKDFRAGLNASPSAAVFFDALSNSLQRYHVDNVNEAKTDETRQRRIERAISLFEAGKKR